MREPVPSGRSTWSDSRPSCETSMWRGRALTPAWPDDLRQALERGLFCPLELDDPEDIPNVGDIKEKYVPYIRRLSKGATGPGGGQPMSQQDLDLEEGKLGDEEAQRGATDVWGNLEEAFKR